MNTLQTVLILVFGGAVILSRFDIKRHFVFFMIRTQKGLVLLDKLALKFKRLVEYLTDAAVVVSFGGLGGAYLVKQKQHNHLYLTLFILGVAGIFLRAPGWFYGILLAAVLGIVVIFLSRLKSPFIGFVFTTLVIFLIVSQVFASTQLSALSSVFGAPALLISGLARHAIEIVFEDSTLPGVSPLLPGSREGRGGVVFPGYDIFIPWWFALIALIVTLVAHEGAHGVSARVEKIRVKSTGILTAGFLPVGAFVEPDEEEIKKKSSLARMRVFAAGSFANFLVAAFSGVIILVFGLFLSSVLVSEGVEVVGVVEDYPAFTVLEVGDVITAVNGVSTPDFNALMEVMEPVEAGDNIVVSTQRGELSVETVSFPEDEDRAYIGIEMIPRQSIREGFLKQNEWLLKALVFALVAVYWIGFFNVNIAFVNLLPVFPFDGFRMLREVVGSMTFGKAFGGKVFEEAVMAFVLVFTLLLFAVNMYPLLGLGA